MIFQKRIDSNKQIDGVGYFYHNSNIFFPNVTIRNMSFYQTKTNILFAFYGNTSLIYTFTNLEIKIIFF